MATFCKIDEKNIVVDVIKISDDDCGGGIFPESEPIGQDFIKRCGIEGNWLQTSFNNNFREVYGGMGFSYDKKKDIFIPSKVRLEDGTEIIPTPPHQNGII